MLRKKKPLFLQNDLAPSETVQMDKSKVLAFCTSEGSANSHTAILARTMNIPAIIGIGAELAEEFDGMEAIADGSAGIVYINPDAETKAKMLKKRDAELRKKRTFTEPEKQRKRQHWMDRRSMCMQISAD